MITAYPFADVYGALDSISIKPFPSTGPSGITIHYTADDSLVRVKKEMVSCNIGYHLLFDKDGKVHQTSRLDHTVNHAGVATWRGISPNRHHLALAVISWGKLDANKKSWSGADVSAPALRNGSWWDACTSAQEASLIKACRYLVNRFNMCQDSLCGHDECALPKGRKIDPGNVMTFTMTDLRHMLWP